MKVRIYRKSSLRNPRIEFVFSVRNIESVIHEVKQYRSRYLHNWLKKEPYSIKVIYKSGYSDSAISRAKKAGLYRQPYNYNAEVFFQNFGSLKDEYQLMEEIGDSIEANFIEDYNEDTLVDMGSDKLLGKLISLTMEFRQNKDV